MSDDQDDSQKTEDPTPKRLEESRKKGQVALSRELNNWIIILAGTIVVGAFSGPLMADIYADLRIYFEQAHLFPMGPGGIAAILKGAFWTTLGSIFFILLGFMVAAFIGPFIQVGPLYAPEVIKPDWKKISLLQGVKRLFSMRALMEFAKGLLKISIVGLTGYIILNPYFGQVEHFINLPMASLLHEMLDICMQLLIGVLAVLMVVTVVDIVYQRNEHMKKMRMSRQELKDEYKQSEGDPHIKGRLRQLRAEKARQRMMQAVPSADVVITNPTHFAVALKYDPDQMEAPICVAKGMDQIALKIREIAKENDIVIHENKPLARALYDTVDIDQMVPPEHYKAVAEIISFVFKLKGRLN